MLPRVVGCCGLAALAACSVFGADATVRSSVVLGPGQRTTLRLRAVPPTWLAVEMEGLGGGEVAFTTLDRNGSTLAHGMLAAGRTNYSCRTNGGECWFEFVAGPDGGAVAYVARSESGIAVDLLPGR